MLGIQTLWGNMVIGPRSRQPAVSTRPTTFPFCHLLPAFKVFESAESILSHVVLLTTPRLLVTVRCAESQTIYSSYWTVRADHESRPACSWRWPSSASKGRISNRTLAPGRRSAEHWPENLGQRHLNTRTRSQSHCGDQRHTGWGAMPF